MSINSFLTNPVKVIIYDPVRSRNIKQFVAIGDVPTAVVRALEKPNEKSASVLSSFYGSNYRQKLNMTKEGRYIDIENIEELLKNDVDTDSTNRTGQVKTVSNIEHIQFDSATSYVSNVCIYPEDKFSELKNKIFAMSGIPPYRQHLFWINGRAETTYNIYKDGIYPIDIRSITEETYKIDELPIDKYLYDWRDSVKVEALDTFQVLEKTLPITNIVYVVDIAQFIYPVRGALATTMQSGYKFDLIYYGFVLKYWPEFTPEVFTEYMANERELSDKYPSLAPTKSHIVQQLKYEGDIINAMYKNSKKISDIPVKIAITQVIAGMTSQCIVNIRNLFDYLETSEMIPEIYAKIEYQNHKYRLQKRLATVEPIQFPAAGFSKTGITLAINYGDIGPALRKQHATHTTHTAHNKQHATQKQMFLNIQSDGTYFIKANWNEEDEMGFRSIFDAIKKVIDPVIAKINSLQRLIFAFGAGLPIVTKNLYYHGLNIALHWKKVITETAFKDFKNLLDPYVRSKIIVPKIIQQTYDKAEYIFTKGMYQFDTTQIEKILTASHRINLNNYYMHLSSSAIALKWGQNYEGRNMRVIHRTTDIKFEIYDIKEAEFNTFYRYILGFLYNAEGELKDDMKRYTGVKKLRKLREQDPELFDLKKHGSDKVYSTICQNQRQPIIYSENEIKGKTKLTKYWNFTYGEPAWYQCPSAKYPNLSFIVGMHPKGYCLPCCNKKTHIAHDGTSGHLSKHQINAVCIEKHSYQAESSGEVSRHIMNYGKFIDTKRLSKLPQASIKQLFANTLQATDQKIPLDYYLYGVPQHVPDAPYVGLIYAAAEALSTNMEDLAGMIIEKITKMSFMSILGGTIMDDFQSSDELTVYINDVFIKKKLLVKARGFLRWNELFIEILHSMGVNVFCFIDKNTHITMSLNGVFLNEIIFAERSGTALYGRNIIVIVHEKNYYPIFVVNPDHYFKSLEVDKKIYGSDDKIIQILCKVVLSQPRDEEFKKLLDLDIIKAFCAASNWRLILKYINKQNLCYGCLLNGGETTGDNSTKKMYVPINYSIHTSDGVPISFQVLDVRDDISVDDVLKFITEFNEFIVAKYSIGTVTKYALIENVRLVSANSNSDSTNNKSSMDSNSDNTTDTKITGVLTNNGIFYTKKTPMVTSTDILSGSIEPLKITPLLYDYLEVNSKIIAQEKPVEDNMTTGIGAALYQNYLYQLFLIEFVNYLGKERNTAIRNEISELIKTTNFSKNISEFKDRLEGLLKGYPGDYKIMQDQINQFYATMDKNLLIEAIKNTDYEFDHMLLQNLKNMEIPELKNKLKEISAQITVLKEVNVKDFPNVYIPCEDFESIGQSPAYCTTRKLIINRDIDDFIEILASDIKSPMKINHIMANIWRDTCRLPLDFIKRPNEIIIISQSEY